MSTTALIARSVAVRVTSIRVGRVRRKRQTPIADRKASRPVKPDCEEQTQNLSDIERKIFPCLDYP